MSRKVSIIVLAILGVFITAGAVYFVYRVNELNSANSKTTNLSSKSETSNTIDTNKTTDNDSAEKDSKTEVTPTPTPEAKDVDNTLTYETEYFSMKYDKSWTIKESSKTSLTLTKDYYIYSVSATAFTTGAGFGKMTDGWSYWNIDPGVSITDKFLRANSFYDANNQTGYCQKDLSNNTCLPNNTWYGSYIYTKDSMYKIIQSEEYFGGSYTPPSNDPEAYSLAGKLVFYEYEDMYNPYHKLDYDTSVNLIPPIKGGTYLNQMISEMDEITKTVVFKK